jgi:hypothetical protein
VGIALAHAFESSAPSSTLDSGGDAALWARARDRPPPRPSQP